MTTRLVPLLALLIPLAGCVNKDMSDLQQFVDEVNARPPSGIEPIPEIKQVEGYVYLPGNRRDPFTRQVDDTTTSESTPDTGLRPDPNRRKEELESYTLDSLRMVGSLEQNAQTWGLVQTTDGTIHRVTAGNYMGRNDGRITRIGEEKIELIELVPTGNGFLEREAALALGEQ